MSARLIVDKKEGLRESRQAGLSPQPAPVRALAKIISYVFHPIFVPVYAVYFMVYIHPYLFAGHDALAKGRTMIMSVVMYSFFPLVTVLLLKALKFIDTVYLATQKDRIIPLVACGVWYFWIWYVWRNLPDYPKPAVQLALAIWISASLGLMANIIMKVSLHAISMGVVLAFFLALAFSQQLSFGIYITIALLASGLVCSSRFILSDHSPREIYGGLATGIISMLIAQWAG